MADQTRPPPRGVVARRGANASSASALLLRAVEVYEVERLHFAAAYLVACAETSGVGAVASFDRSIDRCTGVERLVPAG